MKKWYFTFGLAQYKLAKKYVCIEASTEHEARGLMLRMFGTNWCTMYSEEKWVINNLSGDWDMYVRIGKIPTDALYDAISIGQLFGLTELKFD